MKTPLRVASLICLAVALLLAGCGTKYQPVAGEIVFPDGTPVKGLARGQIVFQKVESGEPTNTVSPSGPIDAEGKFKLGTDGVADGAPEGEYRAVISPPQASGDEQLPKVIDAKYTRANNTTPTYKVTKQPNHLKVIVEPAK